jgi:hypothetical protein
VLPCLASKQSINQSITLKAAKQRFLEVNQTALVTLFERRQLVQTLTLLGVPLIRALTLLTLAFHVLFDLLCEWLTFIPKATPFPQISHLAIYMHLLNNLPIHKTKVIIAEKKEYCK